MSERGCGITASRVLLWIARLAGTAAVAPLMLIALGEPGSGPTGTREWVGALTTTGCSRRQKQQRAD